MPLVIDPFGLQRARMGPPPFSPPMVGAPAVPQVAPVVPPTVPQAPPASPVAAAPPSPSLGGFGAWAPYVDWEWLSSVMQSSRPFPWSPFDVLAVAAQSVGRARRAAEEDLRREYQEVLAQAAQMPEEVRGQFLDEAFGRIREKAATLGVRPPIHLPTFRVETVPIGELDKEYVNRIVQAAISSGATPEQAGALAHSISSMPVRVYRTTDGRVVPSSSDLSELRRSTFPIIYDLVRNNRVPVTLPDGTKIYVSPGEALEFYKWEKTFGAQQARDAMAAVDQVHNFILERLKAGDSVENALASAEAVYSDALNRLGVNADFAKNRAFWTEIANKLRTRAELADKAAQLEVELKEKQVRAFDKMSEAEYLKVLTEIDRVRKEMQQSGALTAAQLRKFDLEIKLLESQAEDWKAVSEIFKDPSMSIEDKALHAASYLFRTAPTQAVQLLVLGTEIGTIPTATAVNMLRTAFESVDRRLAGMELFPGVLERIEFSRSILEMAKRSTPAARQLILWGIGSFIKETPVSDLSRRLSAEQKREVLEGYKLLLEEITAVPGVPKALSDSLRKIIDSLEKGSENIRNAGPVWLDRVFLALPGLIWSAFKDSIKSFPAPPPQLLPIRSED